MLISVGRSMVTGRLADGDDFSWLLLRQLQLSHLSHLRTESISLMVYLTHHVVVGNIDLECSFHFLMTS